MRPRRSACAAACRAARRASFVPQLIFVGGHFKEYQRLGDAAIAVLGDFTPLVERISIDEAFADVAGCTHLFGSPAEIAAKIRARVRGELGLPISVGVARTKHLAKIASQVAKPDGLVVVDPGAELEFLHDLPVELMWGVGPVTKARLAGIGVTTIGAARRDARLVAGAAARAGRRREARARSPGTAIRARSGRIVARTRPARSRRSARSPRPSACSGRRCAISPTASRTRLRAKSRPGRTVTVRVRFADMRSVTRSLTLDAPISATAILAEVAEELVRGLLAEHAQERTISLLAISVSHLEEHFALQLDLPLGLADEPRRPGSRRGMARFVADRAVDKIRDRFGWEAVGYASVALGPQRSVPDAFRELAEKEL